MSGNGYASAVLASRAHLLYRVNGAHEGARYWAYVLVDAPKLAAFQKALAAGNLTVQDFGKVLAWGQGAEPDDSVREALKVQYGFELIA